MRRDDRQWLKLALAATALVAGELAGRAAARAAADRRSESSSDVGSTGSQAPEPATAGVPAPPTSPPQPRRIIGAGRNRWTAAALVVALLLLGSVPTTQAFLSSGAAMQQVATTGVAVQPPTGLTLTEQPGSIDLAWTAPATGPAPAQYEIFKKVGTAAWPATPVTTTTTTGWIDTGVTNCTLYTYRIRSVYLSFRSDFSAERSRTYKDNQAPTVNASALVATSGLSSASHVAGFVKPLGEFSVYADISDTCSGPSAIAAEFDLNGVAGGSGWQSGTHGSYTPVAGGPTYNFRAGPFTALMSLLDGQTPPWSVRARDPGTNVVTAAGSAVTVDAIGPTAVKAPQIASDITDYYAPEVGRGEVRQGTAYRLYGDFADARSGVAPETGAVTGNSAALTTGATASSMPSGGYDTGNGVAWTRRSSAITANSSLSEGSSAFTVTAYDRLGNSTTATGTVEIDNSALALQSCAAAVADGRLRTSDTSTFTFDDAVDPESFSAGWTGAAALPITATMANGAGTNDYFTYSVPLVAPGPPPTGGFDLGAANWTTADNPWSTSTFARTSASAYTVTYKGGNQVNIQASSGTIRPATTVTDAAGNGIPAGTSAACTTAW